MKKLLLFALIFSVPVITDSSEAHRSNINEQKKMLKEERINTIVKAVISVELNGNDNILVNKKENAVGVLQIRPIMVREVNFILHKHRFTLTDRWDSVKSVEMFKIYQDKFNPKWNVERAARLWNGGRMGMRKKATFRYYKRVLKKYLRLKRKS